MFDYPKALQPIFTKMIKLDIKPIIVGGFIRDFFLNIKHIHEDIDIEVYGISSFKKLENVLQEFGDVNSVGKSFGVCKLKLDKYEIDFSLPRTDNKVSSGHKGFKIETYETLDFKTATSRRDFTINSIGYDVKTKTILDPFLGQVDIKNKLLKAVDINTFSQDPLRVFRAVQFASRFEFELDSKLLNLSKKICNNDMLYELAKERIFTEIKKLLLKSKKPSLGFKILKQIDGLKFLSPLEILDENSFNKVLVLLDNIVPLKTNDNKTNMLLMLSALSYYFDKQQTDKFISNLTNEVRYARDVYNLKEIKFQKNYNNSELFILATKINIEFFLLFNEALHSEVEDKVFKNIKQKAIELNILNKKAPSFLKGKDIMACGIEPSKEYSIILKKAYEAQIKLEINNEKEAKEWLDNYLIT